MGGAGPGVDPPAGRGRIPGSVRRHLAGNIAARVAAMVAVGLATLLVARADGAAGVGLLAMLRVLPGLLGVLAASGLPGAIPYFLAAPEGLLEPARRARVRPTIVAMTRTSAIVGGAAWAAAAPLLTVVFFRGESATMVAWAGLALSTQLVATAAKATCQGSHDLTGANAVIMAEEVLFLPAYAVAHLAGLATGPKLIAALVAADLLTALYGWTRLAGRGFFTGWGPPSWPLAREIAGYGARAQLGGLLNLLNLRLDFALLGAIAGPATLGVYAVASKFAEILRLAPLALTYVTYPVLRSLAPADAARRARALLHRAGAATVASIVPVAGAAIVLLPLLYGEEFRPAVVPACILLVGLAGEGYAAVANAFLYGTGRPGLTSLGAGAGVLVTVALDAALIPHHGATGAAVASSAAYLTTAAMVSVFFLSRSAPGPATVAPAAVAPAAVVATHRIAGPGEGGPA